MSFGITCLIEEPLVIDINHAFTFYLMQHASHDKKVVLFQGYFVLPDLVVSIAIQSANSTQHRNCGAFSLNIFKKNILFRHAIRTAKYFFHIPNILFSSFVCFAFFG